MVLLMSANLGMAMESVVLGMGCFWDYFRAEDYHQDYLKKNPDGYCGLGGTGVKYPDRLAELFQPSPAH